MEIHKNNYATATRASEHKIYPDNEFNKVHDDDVIKWRENDHNLVHADVGYEYNFVALEEALKEIESDGDADEECSEEEVKMKAEGKDQVKESQSIDPELTELLFKISTSRIPAPTQATTSSALLYDVELKDISSLSGFVVVKSLCDIVTWICTSGINWFYNNDKEVKAMRHTVKSVVYNRVLSFFGGADRMPPEIQVLFESIVMELDSPLFGKKAFDSVQVKTLLSMIKSCQDLVIVLKSVQEVLHDAIETYGVLTTDHLEFGLLEKYAYEMQNLRKRLIVADSMISKKFTIVEKCTDQNVNDALNLKYWSLLKKSFCLGETCSLSVLEEMEDCSMVTFTALIKAILTIAYFSTVSISRPGYLSHSVKFSPMWCDLKALVDCSTRYFKGALGSYFWNKDELARELDEIAKAEALKRISYSKENQLLRCSTLNLDLIKDLMGYASLAKEESAKLVADALQPPEGGIDQYHARVDQLVQYQEKVQEIMAKLNPLMEAQTFMTYNLRPVDQAGIQGQDGSGKAEGLDENVDPETEVETSSTANVQEPEMYSHSKQDDQGESDHEEEAQDELFLALFGDEEDSEKKINLNDPDQADFFDDKKQHRRLYTGVVSQLKGALVPVKKTMKERENRAVTKRFGKVAEGEVEEDSNCIGSLSDDDNEEEEGDQVPENGDLTNIQKERVCEAANLEGRGAPVTFIHCEELGSSEQYSSRNNDDDNDDETGHFTAPPDFLKELMSKLNNGLESESVIESESYSD